MRHAVLLSSLMLLAFTAARADDSSNGVALPGWHAEPPGSVHVAETVVALHDDAVAIAQSLEEHGAQPVALTLHMPSFGWLGEAETYPDRQFPELRVTLDDTAPDLQDSFVAFYKNTDISDDIRKAGLDPYAIAATPPIVQPTPSGAGAFDRLAEMGAIRKYAGLTLANWTAQRTLRLTLPPGAHKLVVQYQARPAYQLLPAGQIAAKLDLSAYCTTPESLRSALGPLAAADVVLRQYEIATGIDDTPSSRTVFSHSGKAALTLWCRPDAKAAPSGVLRVMTVSKAE